MLGTFFPALKMPLSKILIHTQIWPAKLNNNETNCTSNAHVAHGLDHLLAASLDEQPSSRGGVGNCDRNEAETVFLLQVRARFTINHLRSIVGLIRGFELFIGIDC